MSQPTPPIPVAYQSHSFDADASHLNILSICYWVWGGLTAVFSSVGLIHVTLGIMALQGNFPAPPNAGTTQPFPEEVFGWMFIIMGGLIVTLGWIIGLLSVYAGFCLRKQRRWLLCMIVGGLNCISIPIGTVLGIFTFIVLARPSVKYRFTKH